MEAVTNFASENPKLLRETSSKADKYILDNFGSKKKQFPIKYKLTKNHVDFKYKGFERIYKESKIAGDKVINYTDKKTEKVVPYYNEAEVVDSIILPNATVPDIFSIFTFT